MKKIMLLLTVLLVFPAAFAGHIDKEESIKLLAVSVSENSSYTGSVADLKLEIKEGSGRVFIESFPLTKIDTQITTRTAKQIACDYLDTNCDKYDFFYTISSQAAIVGGPSAGAATAILTIALLEDLELDKTVTATGTINSGGIIGSVSAIKEKIDAASKNGIKKVIIPYGERYLMDENRTIDLAEYGKEKGIEVFEASDITEALEIFTGKKIEKKQLNFTINENYINTMSAISERLCNRSNDILSTVLREGYAGANIINNESAKLEEEAFNLTEKARASMQRKEFYTAASYCYGANVKYSQMLMIEQNISYNSLNKTMEKLENNIEKFEKEIDKAEIRTITDLESYMIAKERISEARNGIEDFRNSGKNNKTDVYFSAASSIERLSSAKSWFTFYGTSGAKLRMDNEQLKQACSSKISEAEERYQYVDLYFPGLMSGTRAELSRIYSEHKSGNFALCLFLASKTKAEIEAVMSTIGVEEAKIDLLINQRLKAAENVIAEQNSKGIFPIFGYSYYEYALNLKQNNQTKATALVYTQYAIELSELDIYFRQKKSESVIRFDKETLKIGLVFLAGFVIGVCVYDIVMLKRKKKKKH